MLATFGHTDYKKHSAHQDKKQQDRKTLASHQNSHDVNHLRKLPFTKAYIIIEKHYQNT